MQTSGAQTHARLQPVTGGSFPSWRYVNEEPSPVRHVGRTSDEPSKSHTTRTCQKMAVHGSGEVPTVCTSSGDSIQRQLQHRRQSPPISQALRSSVRRSGSSAFDRKNEVVPHCAAGTIVPAPAFGVRGKKTLKGHSGVWRRSDGIAHGFERRRQPSNIHRQLTRTHSCHDLSNTPSFRRKKV